MHTDLGLVVRNATLFLTPNTIMVYYEYSRKPDPETNVDPSIPSTLITQATPRQYVAPGMAPAGTRTEVSRLWCAPGQNGNLRVACSG